MKTTFAALALCVGATPLFAQQSETDCTALRDVVFSGGYVTSARAVAAQNSLPSYCEVRATALPSISIEVRLPLENWNGKYYQAGCGGFCGILGRADAGASWVNAMRPGLELGYATATSDSGHHALSVVDAAWAANNPHAERDWGWRSIGETNRVAGVLIDAFYGGQAEQAIFQGCSTGGRMAHVAAQRYPEMFDGIISGAPAMDYTGLVATAMAFFVQAKTADDGSQILGPDDAKAIGDLVMQQCDATDGTEDGLIEDPRACEIDYSSLGLSNTKMDALMKWREGPRNAAGDQLYPGGIPEGSEPFWWLWLTGNAEGAAPLVPAFTTGFTQYMAFADDPGAEYSPLDFDIETDPARLETMAEVYNGDNPDLSAFRAAGGKMIVYHGWADAIVTPYKTVDWYEQASEAAGGEETLKESVRLFMVPGLDHCGILPGPGGINAASLDPMAPMERWLNDDTPPTSIMAE
ncbi:tannase/feruloyl esterase family alpha/beta hydrolase [Sagittula stellata]|uniref:Feruloyl esterase n=1 Tax=Sagittula stellata (strain ATCC 700073 / DSM 11524 / E-37) TaxID=388399 RepID=A3JX52_SAGS3|nr:tannase/feruloyl esterase family alpha/beta hydrolase [Sagittula stellata]EBA10088.1 Feruloyl esterase [Sagittula stellata E-37]